jgi:hypothetical protein
MPIVKAAAKTNRTHFFIFLPPKNLFLDVVNVSLSGEETAVTDSKRGFFLKKPRPK